MDIDFSSYQNPGKARQIWRSYHSELNGLGGLRRAETLASQCRTSDELDARLDLLLTELQSGRSMKYTGRYHSGDPTADGSLDNSRRHLEDFNSG